MHTAFLSRIHVLLFLKPSEFPRALSYVYGVTPSPGGWVASQGIIHEEN